MVINLSEGQYPRNKDTGNMNDHDGLLQRRGLLSLPSHGYYKHRYTAASEIYNQRKLLKAKYISV